MSLMQQWEERFLQFQLRERYFISAAVLVLLLWCGLLYGVEPLWSEAQKQQQQYQQTSKQLQVLQQQIDAVQQVLQQDPDEQLQSEINAMNTQQQQLLEQIRAMTGRYISGAQMVQLLKDVLASQQGVSLLALENLPAEAVALPGMESSQPLLYRHGTKLVFAGSYAALQQLLTRLEQLPWQLHWSQLRYKVSQFPKAELELELETVSEHDSYLQI
ncbi:type II secretion system protein M [Rheinheimera sp. 4Y26]|uniref:type II secretion system protein M n=1 Tax=Rheinheimera sp. 4Y26 TaxID=2977811 RepID=UPI0021B13EFB|nr:type II secretion system protein M [Rheinheimera sp. 4Y26]MCT6698317.1 type II secretion system protein M [Rheinheimera sp. 4Y26]